MPPLSYVITAVVLAGLVVASFPVTLGYSIMLWYWLFAIAACVLAVVGAFRIVGGLHAPLWIGVALALPGFVWAAEKLYFYFVASPVSGQGFYFAMVLSGPIALLVAAVGALRLAEMTSGPHVAFRVGYGVLAVSVLVIGIGWTAYATGSTFTKNPLYARPEEALGIAATLIKYGAFIAAAILITMRRNIEYWAGAVISLISAYLLYTSMRSAFLTEIPTDDLMFWLQPVIMFVGGAAVWRMGSALRAQAFPEPSVPG